MKIDDIAARLSQRAVSANKATLPASTVPPVTVSAPTPTIPSPTVTSPTVPTPRPPSLIALPKLPYPFSLSPGMPPVLSLERQPTSPASTLPVQRINRHSPNPVSAIHPKPLETSPTVPALTLSPVSLAPSVQRQPSNPITTLREPLERSPTESIPRQASNPVSSPAVPIPHPTSNQTATRPALERSPAVSITQLTVPTTVPGFLPRPVFPQVSIKQQPQQPANDNLSAFGSDVSLNCGVTRCKFDQQAVHFHCRFERCKFDQQAVHFHCRFERCFFSSRSSSAISSHLSSFHSQGLIPKHLTYTHADSECPEQACSLSGESHFHCATCRGHFFYGNSQGTHRCNPERQAVKLRRSSSALSPQKVTKACNRPYCKLKKNSVHFHCLVCSQGFTSHERLASHLRKHQRADIRQATATGSSLSSPDARCSHISRPDSAPFSVVSSPPTTFPIPRPATVIRHHHHTTTVIGPLGIHPEMLRLLQRGPGIAVPGVVGPGTAVPGNRRPGNGLPENRVTVVEIQEVE